ncbi:hypothetical protein [Novosphingobium sp.]|uniref:hypothetical protein n=1 Tax=Novosphingobium sp. TaxID=1874826 RepID=UPI002FE3A2E7
MPRKKAASTALAKVGEPARNVMRPPDDERSALANMHGFKGLARLEEIAAFTRFLLSDRASFITGTKAI